MTETLLTWLRDCGELCRPYLHDVALGIIATLLVIFGDDINKSAKRAVGKKNLIVRMVAFILLCTFGYGVLTVQLTEWMKNALGGLQNSTLPVVILGSFLLLSYLAEKKNQV
jgi:undecaprenyl pyrophosphate phosphatase UppP